MAAEDYNSKSEQVQTGLPGTLRFLDPAIAFRGFWHLDPIL